MVDLNAMGTLQLPLVPLNGGRFISAGMGRHPTRVIDSWELIVVEHGRLTMFEDDRNYAVEPGQALVLRPGRRHGGVGDYPSGLSFFWLHFRLAQPVADSVLPTWSSCPEQMLGWCRDFLALQTAGLLLPYGGALLLLLMLQALGGPAMTPAPDGGRLAADALKYVKLHFREPIATADIADALQCNPDYLGRVFRRAYGITPVDCLNRERLGYAGELLLDTAMNVNEIAEASGYRDPAYFRRRFREKNGMTPLRYRRLYGKIHINTR